jgi:hypothetical protein
MRTKTKRYRTLAKAIAKMPSLKHKPNELFDITKSQVVNWLIDQPEVRQDIYDQYRRFMVFDPETKTWRGNGKANVPTSGSFSLNTMVRVEAPF